MDNFQATDKQRALVAQMAACGIPVDEIALAVEKGVPPTLLYTHFARELATGAIRANVRVGDALFKLATEGNPTAAIFWAKTRMGWKESGASTRDDNSWLRTVADEQLDARIVDLLHRAILSGLTVPAPDSPVDSPEELDRSEIS